MRPGLRRTLIVLGIVGVVVVAARIAAPVVVERFVNRQLADMGEYRGSVTDIELNFIRGGYVLRNLEIVKRDATGDIPPWDPLESTCRHASLSIL